MIPQLFSYEGQPVRTEIRDGEPWFIAKDICDILEIVNNRDAYFKLDQDEKGVVSTDTPGGKQDMQAVNEYGLYSLVLSSRKPEAKAFKRWITHDVIPSIRKTGSYSNQSLSPQLQILISMELRQKELEEGQARNQSTLIDHEFKLADIDQKVTNEITLTTREQGLLQGAVSSRVTRIASRPYRALYSDLKRHFVVPSYRDIKRSDLTKAFEFIRCWSPRIQ